MDPPWQLELVLACTVVYTQQRLVSAQATLLLHKIEISNIYISLLISLITWMIEVHTMTEDDYSLYMVKYD